MVEDARINLGLRLVSVDADGTPCVCCGEIVYLRAYCIEIYMVSTGERLGLAPTRICQSCVELGGGTGLLD